MARLVLLLAILILVAPNDARGQKLTEQDIKNLKALPPSTLCRKIDFKTANVFAIPTTNIQALIVTGTKPVVNMTVDLKPLVYVRKPEYWGIEVTGCVGIELPQIAPYLAAEDISSMIGTKGIEVIGATGSKKIDVP